MIPVPSDTDELQIHDHGEHTKVRYLTLNRPQSKNGLTIEILGALIKALNDAEANDAVRTVVLTGKGESFCSGLDLKAAMAMVMGGGLSGEELVRANEERMRNYFHRVIRTLQSLSKPVLALGRANYAVPGVAATAEGDEELAQAFATARDWELDAGLTEAFLRLLAEEYYVPWPITDPGTRERVRAQVLSRFAGRLWEP